MDTATERVRLLLPGLALVVAGLVLFARVPVHGSYLTDVLPTMILLGTGGPAARIAARTSRLAHSS